MLLVICHNTIWDIKPVVLSGVEFFKHCILGYFRILESTFRALNYSLCTANEQKLKELIIIIESSLLDSRLLRVRSDSFGSIYLYL